MLHGNRTRYWYWWGGLLGLALAQVAPVEAQAAGRGGEVFDRRGTTYERRAPESTWRHRFGGGYGRRDARSGGTEHSAGGGSRGPNSGRGGDPEAPEPTAALLFGIGALAVQRAARKARVR